jgi:multidrug efflux pump subunit AcrA (membrane-fusion protein)
MSKDTKGPDDKQDSSKKSTDAKMTKPNKERNDTGRLWVVVDGFVQPIRVTVGPSDGNMTVVEGEKLKEGMKVVIGEGNTEDTADDTTNPFAPKIFSGKKMRL